MKYIIRPALTMFITAVFSVAALSWVHAVTLEPIQRQMASLQDSTMHEVLPQATGYSALDIELPDQINGIFEGTSGGNVIGYVVEVWDEGYGGPITMMVGISSETESLAGMRVLSHTETPGLGTPIMDEPFYSQFEGMALTPITVVKGSTGPSEIDALTSATITTEGVAGAINLAIEWYNGGTGR